MRRGTLICFFDFFDFFYFIYGIVQIWYFIGVCLIGNVAKADSNFQLIEHKIKRLDG